MDKQLMMFEGREILILLADDVDFKFEGDFLIHAGDVAVILAYAKTENVYRHCKQKHIYVVKNANISDSPIRVIRKLNNAGESFISNLSLNRVLGKTEMPKAEPFQDWLYEDMLPSVQKYGGYLTPSKIEEVLNDPDTIIRLATQLKHERKEKQALNAKIEQQQPLVGFAEICLQSDQSIKVRDLAHSLTSHGVNIGQNKLFIKLREWDFICKKSTEPTQRGINQGLFEVVQGVKKKPNGDPFMWRTPYVTVKGQVHIADRLKKEIQ